MHYSKTVFPFQLQYLFTINPVSPDGTLQTIQL
jgi:hypothetical protein